VLLTVLLTPYLGVNGAPAGFACNYVLYWLFMAWLVRSELKKMKQ
jgi:O-antigen/teichoic acid export membrane protein